MHLPTCVDEVLKQREVCQAFGKAPHAPVAGIPTVNVFNEKLQADLLFLVDIIALRIMNVFSKYSLLIPVRTKSPQEVREASRNPWVGDPSSPMSIQADEGGERKHEVRAELRSARRIKLLFQEVGAHPWILERRKGLARGIYNRLKEDDRFSGARISRERSGV